MSWRRSWNRCSDPATSASFPVSAKRARTATATRTEMGGEAQGKEWSIHRRCRRTCKRSRWGWQCTPELTFRAGLVDREAPNSPCRARYCQIFLDHASLLKCPEGGHFRNWMDRNMKRRQFLAAAGASLLLGRLPAAHAG